MSEAVYKLATTLADYRRAQDCCRRGGYPRVTLSFPTIIAERDGQVVGVLATGDSRRAVFAHRIVAETPQMFIRLAEAYEFVLLKAGVTSYLIPADETNEKLLRALEKAGTVREYARQDGIVWFQRPVMRKVA